MSTKSSRVYANEYPKAGQIWRWHIPSYMADVDSPAADDYFCVLQQIGFENYIGILLGDGREEEFSYNSRNYVNWYRIS